MSKNTKDPFSELKCFFLKWVSTGFKKIEKFYADLRSEETIQKKQSQKTVLKKKKNSMLPENACVRSILYIWSLHKSLVFLYPNINFSRKQSLFWKGTFFIFVTKIENLQTKTGKNTNFSDLGIPNPIHKRMNEMDFFLKGQNHCALLYSIPWQLIDGTTDCLYT